MLDGSNGTFPTNTINPPVEHRHVSYNMPCPSSWTLDSTDLLLVMSGCTLGLTVIITVVALLFYIFKYRSDVITESFRRSEKEA